MVADAEFVCIVESTKCHVKAASIANIAVSLSLISHTIIIFGSCLTNDLSQLAKSNHILGFT
jgi:hypothetical protein